MGDTIEYSDIHQEIRGFMNPGRLKIQSESVIFKNIKTGKVDQFSAKDIESTQWLMRARGYCLKFILSNETIHRYDGIKESEYEKLSTFFKKHYETDLEQINMCLKGWNWGTAKFQANALDFEIDGKPAFEIPLGNVSHSITSKNEVTVEFHPNDDAPVSLMELRFHIPADNNSSEDPVQEFYKNVIAKADIIQATGDAIAIFTEVQCLTPRGRYDIKIYQTFIQLHGKTFDYKIPHTTVLRLFLLPHRDGRQMFFVMSLDPPIKQGQTRYPFLIMMFNNEDETTLQLGVSEEDLEKKYDGKLQQEMSGLEYEVIARIVKTLVNRKVTQSGSFKGHGGSQSIACSYKAGTGFLYPLDRGFIFVHKPPIHVRFDEIASVNFARSTGSTTRSFDFEIETTGGNGYNFVGIQKEEYGKLYDYVSTKKLRVKNIGEKGSKSGGYADDMEGSDAEGEHDAYLERMKAEGKNRDSDDLDDDTDSSDESFNPGESGSEVAEEYDTDAGSSSTSSSDENTDETEEQRQQRKEARRKEKEKERKAKVVREPMFTSGGAGKKRKTKGKKDKDPDRPTRPASAYLLWLNEHRDQIKEENPGFTIIEVTKRGGEMWREVKDRSKWEGLANQAKERYQDAMADYNTSKEPSSPKAKKKKGSPKKPAGDSKAGSGGAFKSKEFISSSDSSDNEGSKAAKKKKKKPAKKPTKKEESASGSESAAGSGSGAESGSESDEPKEKKVTRSKGKVADLKDGDEEFANLPSDEEILDSPGKSGGSASGSGSESSEGGD